MIFTTYTLNLLNGRGGWGYSTHFYAKIKIGVLLLIFTTLKDFNS